MYKVLPVLQSTRNDFRQDSEDYLNSGHTLNIIVLFGSNLHFATFNYQIYTF